MANSPVGRRLRISSTRKPGSIYSRDIDVSDANTGENVPGICKIVLILDVNRQINEAELTYYEVGDKGGIMIDENGDPIKQTITVQNVEIDDITALEIPSERRITHGNDSRYLTSISTKFECRGDSQWSAF